jgi:gamma-glutamyltranspeptidase/glutathione hydrolase
MNSTPVFARAAVAAPHLLAVQSGRDILAAGGNAIEAMVAMAVTIAVVYPHMNSIGGDGCWLVAEPRGRVRAIEACGFAGAKATIALYRGLEYETVPARGPLAALTVPGAVGGWQLALEFSRAQGGRLPLADLLADAIRHARSGVAVSPCEARTLPLERTSLTAAPGFAQNFLVDGKAAGAGTMRKSEALAATLAQLADAGLDDFYRGDVGREIAADLERIGAPVTRADLENYRAVLREPLALRLAGRTHYNTPPPTQGLAALIILGIFERLGIRAAGSFEYVHALVEATKRAFAIRDAVCTDFDRLRHDIDSFLTPAALAREAAAIRMDRAAAFPMPPSKGDTVWMGAIDASGLAVSYIQSIYWEYGSGCVLPRTGILMQNRGTAFSLDEGAVNPLEPGRRPPHTLAPALVAFDDGRVMPLGAMGGDGQPQFQAQVFTRTAFGMGLADAVAAPRFLFGRSWGEATGNLTLDERFDPALVRALENAGHVIVLRPAAADIFGHAGALVRHVDGHVEATHDPRADGGAAGL